MNQAFETSARRILARARAAHYARLSHPEPRPTERMTFDEFIAWHAARLR